MVLDGFGDGLVLDEVHLQLVHRVLEDGGEVGGRLQGVVVVPLLMLELLLGRDRVDLPPAGFDLGQWVLCGTNSKMFVLCGSIISTFVALTIHMQAICWLGNFILFKKIQLQIQDSNGFGFSHIYYTGAGADTALLSSFRTMACS